MSEVPETGSPVIFATRSPPSAIAIDDDIYLTVAAADLHFRAKSRRSTLFCRSNTRGASSRSSRVRSAPPPTTRPPSERPELEFVSCLGRRRRQCDAQARAIVRAHAFETMQFRDGCDEAQAESSSRRLTRDVGAMEAPEDRLQVFGRDSRSVVGDRHEKRRRASAPPRPRSGPRPGYAEARCREDWRTSASGAPCRP